LFGDLTLITKEKIANFILIFSMTSMHHHLTLMSKIYLRTAQIIISTKMNGIDIGKMELITVIGGGEMTPTITTQMISIGMIGIMMMMILKMIIFSMSQMIL